MNIVEKVFAAAHTQNSVECTKHFDDKQTLVTVSIFF